MFLSMREREKREAVGWNLLEEGSECHLKGFGLALQEAMSYGSF